MAKASLQSVYNISPDEIWQPIGQFNALPDWQPAVQGSRLEDHGQARRLSLLGGGEVVARLEISAEKERLYRVSSLRSQLPVANYTATLRARDDGAGRALVEWSSESEPTAGAPGNDPLKAVQDCAQAGLDNRKKTFGL